MHTILIILIVALVVGAAYFYFQSSNARFNSKTYQAVFLDNEQVYFGKVTRQSKESIELADVYYLQVNSSSVLAGINESAEDSFALIKLGNELHGPDDTMFINREHVLYIENLQSDSRIVVAIENHKAK